MYLRSAIVTGFLLAAGAFAQQPPANPPAAQAPGTIFRTETKLVPVDVVVQDKKGNYVHDLEQKDFKVMEDNKEQQIRAFSFEADPNSPLAQQKKYLVLFFDNSTMNLTDQAQARQAAAKFIDANAGPNRLMAIANFGGSLQIAQNFTDDIERLKAIVAGTKIPAISTSAAGVGGPSLGSVQQFGMRTGVLALRGLAKVLGDIPGRKTLILFSAGFNMNNPTVRNEMYPEITAAIDACNRANVAVYPVDVRGLASNLMPFDPRRGAVMPPGVMRDAGLAFATSPVLRVAALFQRGGGAGGGTTGGGGGGTGAGAGGGGGGGTPSGGGGGATGGGGGRSGGGNFGGSSGPFGGSGTTRGGEPGGFGNTGGRGSFPGNNGNNGGGGNNGNFGGRGNNPNDRNNRINDPMNRRGIIPTIPDSIMGNQEVLYMLANGTGGFVIANTNDLLGGLQKIGKEQNEYYLLAYAPPESPEGSCHEIKVKVNKGGLNLRSRTGYCNVKQVDLLSGKPIEKQMETMAAGSDAGSLKAAPMQVPFFYTATNTAKVFVAMDIPTSTIKFEKVKGKQHAEISVLGIATRPDGNIAARFSDSVKKDFEDKKDVEKFLAKPMHYENQFDLGSGEYNLKVVFTSAGAGFGKLEAPLKIEPYDTAQFGMSALALSGNFHRRGADSNIEDQLVEGKTPLIAGALQFEPAGATRFKTGDQVAVYFEVYEPLMQEDPSKGKVDLAGQMRILDRASGAQKLDSGGVPLTNFLRQGNPMTPVGLKLPLENLGAGGYKLEVKVVDSAGRSWTRTTEFDVM